MADLNMDQMNALNRFLGTLTNAAGGTARGMNELNEAVGKSRRAETANAALVHKMSNSNKVYIDRIAEMNRVLTGSSSKMSIFAGSINLADKGINKLLTSSDVTADYLQKKFPKELEKGLSAFVSKTGVAINDFRDVMRLQDISSETKRLVDGFADGTRTQYTHVKQYMDLLGKAGTSVTKMAGMSRVAEAEFRALTKGVEQARVGTVERDQAEAEVTKFMIANQAKLAKSASDLATKMAEVADEADHMSKVKAVKWDVLESQGAMGKIIGSSARGGGGGTAGALRQLQIAAAGASINLIRSFGSKAITEMMDMARTGMQKGVEPFPKIAGQLRMSGKDYQEVMAANKQAVASSTGGYKGFNELMLKHNQEFMAVTGKDPVLSGKMAAGSMSLVKGFAGAKLSSEEVSREMTGVVKDMGRMRDTFGMTAEETLAMNERIMESSGIHETAIRMSKEERLEMRKSINARIVEYGNMGLSAKKAEELVVLMQKASGIKTPKDIMKEAAKEMQYSRQMGMGEREAQELMMLSIKRGTAGGLGNEEAARFEKLKAIQASKEMEDRAKVSKQGLDAQLAHQVKYAHFDQQRAADQKEMSKLEIEKKMSEGKAAVGGALGAGEGAIMGAGGAMIDVKNAIDTLNSNVSYTWALWGGAIVAAITLSSIGMGGVKGAITKAATGLEKMSGKTGKELVKGATDMAKSSKTLGAVGGALKTLSWAKGAAAGAGGLALMGAQALTPEDSTAGKMLNSNTANYGMLGATVGSFIPGVGTLVGAGVGGAIGAGMDIYDYATSPTAPSQTPPEIANQHKAEMKEKQEEKKAKAVDINQLMLTQLQQSNMKLDGVTKTLKEGNDLYAMTEDEKKALMAKRKISTGR